LAAARLAFRRRPWPRPSREDLTGLGLVAGALAAWVGFQRLGLFAEEGERLIVAAVALTAALMATSRGPRSGSSTSVTLALAVIPISSWALLVSQTRSAWLGALAGLTLVAVLRAPKLLWLLAAGVVVVLAFRPAPVMRRMTFTDVSSVDRYYMWQAGVDMVLDKPLFGQGPGMIPVAYPKYRWPEAPSSTVPHLHNNPLQLAAERGVPCTAFWLWWLALALARALRERRLGGWDGRWVSVGSLGFLCAILVAGMFEYNFGDSEVLYVILILSVMPFMLSSAARRAEPSPAP
jgi:putative inorganic carbon (HCO3(-)) transporter